MTKPRILFINRSYWPDTEATGQLLTSLCEGLTDDYEVEVLAGSPNHVQNKKIAATVGMVRRHGVVIQRVSHTRFSKSSWLGRLLNLISFTVAAFLAILWRRPKPDLIITETDPFFLPLLGQFAKWWHGVPFVAYLQDIYPDVAISVGKAKEGTVTRFLRRKLVAACNQADRVVVLSEDMKERCIANGVRHPLIDIIPNWADCNLIRPVKVDNEFRKQHLLHDKFVVMYSGNLGMVHLLDPILDAAVQLRNDSRITFVFIGEGVQKSKLMRQAADQELTNVRFFTYQPREYLSHSLSAADIQIISMLPTAKGCIVPSKLYGILAAETAVLSLCPTDSDVSRLVEKEDVGVVCDPEPSETLATRLATTIRRMADHSESVQKQGQRGRRLCFKEFDRPLQIRRFSSVMNRVLGSAGSNFPTRIPANPLSPVTDKEVSVSKL